VRTPALAKARAVPSGRPLRSQALDASQYSSKDEGLRLMSDNSSPNSRDLQGYQAGGRSGD
jgi:hypothetical protein